MSPAASRSPAGALADAIERDFGGLEQFKLQFSAAGSKQFGSGWVWAARKHQDGGALQIYTITGHDNPLMQGHFPILVNDVWEHAYYLNYENRRNEYLNAWWQVANWEEAARRFERSDQSAKQVSEGEGGALRAAPA